MRVRILAQGDEITTGATTDTNSGWLATRLTARGARVLGIAAVPDDPVAIAALLRAAAADCDLVVCTGGLGPTDDDDTAEAAAAAAGVPLREDPEALRQVEARFAAFHRPMPPVNRRQARLPAGATLLENRHGTAPGFAFTLGSARVFCFPGVPRELMGMVPEHLDPWLDARGLVPAARRRLHVCGVGESTLQERLTGCPIPPGIRVGYKAWLPYVSIVLYADGGAGPALDAAAAAVRERLGPDRFGEDDTTFPQAVGAALRARGWTLGGAESCTGGGLGALVTEAPGASAWFRGSVVAYANDVKRHLLGVDPEILATHGAVSEACAGAMAAGVPRALGADVGLAITGIAGPDGGTPEKPVGMVCLGLALPGAPVATRTIRYGDRGRDVVRTLAAAHALEWLRRRVLANSPE